MTVHQCPKCELRFEWLTELDQHCREDHPHFHHDYPVRGVRHNMFESPTSGDSDAGSRTAGEQQRPRPS